MKLRVLRIVSLCSIFFNALLAALSFYSKTLNKVFEFAQPMVSDAAEMIKTGTRNGWTPAMACSQKYKSSQGLVSFFCDEQTNC